MSKEQPAPAHVAVVVLNYNGLEDTLKCLESLRHVEYKGLLSIILVDNGSSVDPGPQALARYPGLTVIRTGENLGYAGGNNRGIDRALANGADFVLVLNNDTVVAPNIITDLVEGFAADPSLGVVGPVINFLEERDVVMTDGVQFNPGPGAEFFHRIVVSPGGPLRLVTVDIVNGCCLMMRADALRRIGTFDERLFIVHEESDLCLRALRAGFRCAVINQTLVWHEGSSSFERSGRELQRYFDTRNLYYLIRRHSGKVSASRPQLISLWHYLRYAYYRFSIELEAGKTLAERAVANGVWDAVRGRTGPYVSGRHVGATMIAGLFSCGRWLSLHRHSVRPAER
jgi:GT2 family glycosyltransferase